MANTIQTIELNQKIIPIVLMVNALYNVLENLNNLICLQIQTLIIVNQKLLKKSSQNNELGINRIYVLRAFKYIFPHI